MLVNKVTIEAMQDIIMLKSEYVIKMKLIRHDAISSVLLNLMLLMNMLGHGTIILCSVELNVTDENMLGLYYLK